VYVFQTIPSPETAPAGIQLYTQRKILQQRLFPVIINSDYPKKHAFSLKPLIIDHGKGHMPQHGFSSPYMVICTATQKRTQRPALLYIQQ
jgi:hypothetical protein